MGLKLGEYARRMGFTHKQAWIMFKNGTLPHPAKKISTRMIIVDVPSDFGLTTPQQNVPKKTALYARVNSHKQKDDLERQTNRILRYAATHDIKIDNITEEIASGKNGNRPKLNKLLTNSDYDIIIEHRERLTRFAFEAIENALKAQGRKIIVIDDKEIDDDLVRDATEVLMSCCARLYGRRGVKNRTEAALQTLQGGDDKHGKTETENEPTE